MSDYLLEDQELDVGVLREAIQEEYAEVAANPQKGFHFHTGHPLARMLEYADKKVGPEGRVIGVDMTPSMLEKARQASKEAKLTNVEFRKGYAEALPVEDGWADVVISNGVLNLMPDKSTALEEMSRMLKPNGRLQIGDILVQKAVPDSAKRKIELWTG
jgi:arsenite methyltransferase